MMLCRDILNAFENQTASKSKRTVNLIEALQVALHVLGDMHREEGRPVNGSVGQTGSRCYLGGVPPCATSPDANKKRATALPMRCLRGPLWLNGGFQTSVFTSQSLRRCLKRGAATVYMRHHGTRLETKSTPPMIPTRMKYAVAPKFDYVCAPNAARTR